jgi:CRP/FNR family transcriptional regulator, cyclic AMP receptor protein
MDAPMVKKLLRRLSTGANEDAAAADASTADTEGDTSDSGFFTTLFMEREGDAPPLATWRERAQQVQAQAVPRPRGEALFQAVWADEKHTAALGPDGLLRLGHYLEFVQLAAEREVIVQDEQGDFLLIVLEGALAVDRVQPLGARARLGEAHPGDLLGEMSLLDAGARFSACRTLKPSVLAILEAGALDRMMANDPRLAAALLATLARRLSLRLRQSSARLSTLLAQP